MKIAKVFVSDCAAYQQVIVKVKLDESFKCLQRWEYRDSTSTWLMIYSKHQTQNNTRWQRITYRPVIQIQISFPYARLSWNTERNFRRNNTDPPRTNVDRDLLSPFVSPYDPDSCCCSYSLQLNYLTFLSLSLSVKQMQPNETRCKM